ncbi:lipocalin/fatty-acid binding family protein [Escherichia coli]|nr:lipocalin/fatty-acid binding family protein [Escherichia coli]MCI3756293.1 lipocalin/fatty-acid binding family protein [Escherichia coli]
MAALNGKWKLVSSENFDAYLDAIGVAGELKEKALKLLSPENNITQEITVSGDTIKINTTTPLSSVEVNATVGQEVDSRSLDGRTVKSVYTLDGETLVETISGGYSTISRRFVEGGQLIMKLSASGVDAIRHYDKV